LTVANRIIKHSFPTSTIVALNADTATRRTRQSPPTNIAQGAGRRFMVLIILSDYCKTLNCPSANGIND